ncbi:MAG: photosystem II oxygen evolving complex protein PsbP [Synechococcaceae cyanobacterium SM2_3_1]|nr:photosystem II oxygen evolving complex protein PsbP [Synechococcaceae cyanobacterium SM2_3_1]
MNCRFGKSKTSEWQQLFLCILIGLTLVLSSCGSAVGLRTYNDAEGLISFSYPNGMVAVESPSLAEAKVVLTDLVNNVETVSLMVSPYDQAERIEEMGSPAEVGQRVKAHILAPEGSNREATLINAGQLQTNDTTYYLLEFNTSLAGIPRHELVTVTIKHDQLYTLTASTSDSRWPQMKDTFYTVAQSLRVV